MNTLNSPATNNIQTRTLHQTNALNIHEQIITELWHLRWMGKRIATSGSIEDYVLLSSCLVRWNPLPIRQIAPMTACRAINHRKNKASDWSASVIPDIWDMSLRVAFCLLNRRSWNEEDDEEDEQEEGWCLFIPSEEIFCLLPSSYFVIKSSSSSSTSSLALEWPSRLNVR